MRRKLSLVFLALGILCLVAATVLAGYFLLEDRRAAKTSADLMRQFDFPEVAAEMRTDLPPSRREYPDYMLDPNMDMPVVSVDGYDCIAVVEIPKLNRKLPVLSTWSEELLRVAPCRYAGSAYAGDLIIAAHNYVAHFGSLATLQNGDAVTLTDMDGNVLSYIVTEIATITPDAVEELCSGYWDLTLFTCTFGNTYRTVVRCTRQ